MIYASLGAPGHVTKLLQDKKLTNLNQYILVITDIDEKCFVVFEHTINHLSFGYVRLFQLEYYFSCFGFFFLLLFFFFCRYLLLNHLTHCIQSLSNWRYQEGLLQQKSRVPGWGDPSPLIMSSKILIFYTSRVRWINFLEWVDIKNKQNLTKIGGFPSNEPSKIQSL